MLGEIGKLKEKLPIKESSSDTKQDTLTQSSSINPFSDLINKLLKEKACYQNAISNIKMVDVDRVNQLRADIANYTKCSGDYNKQHECYLNLSGAQKELIPLNEKTNRSGFEKQIKLIDDMLNSLYKGQYPSTGNPSAINFCDKYKYMINL